jgi:hypothetical protein
MSPALTAIQGFNLKRHGIGFSSWAESNSVRIHAKTESNSHFILKAIVCKILYDNGRVFFSEVNTRDGVADVYDFTGKRIIEVQGINSPEIDAEKNRKLFNGSFMNDLIILRISDYDIYDPETWDKIRYKLGLS